MNNFILILDSACVERRILNIINTFHIFLKILN